MVTLQTICVHVCELIIYSASPHLAVFLYGVQELQSGVPAVCLTVCHHGSGRRGGEQVPVLTGALSFLGLCVWISLKCQTLPKIA